MISSARMHRLITLSAVLVLALPIASALAKSEQGHGKPQGSAKLLAAADRFDKVAAKLTQQATRLHAAATDARRDAEALVLDADEDGTGDEPLVDIGLMGASAGDTSTDGGADPATDCATEDCAPTTTTPVDDEAEALLEEADDLDAQAARLEKRAARATAQAARLREQAAKVLAKAGAAGGPAAGLLKRARKARSQATSARVEAAGLRPSAFDGSSVDEDIVDQVERLEERASQLEARADKLEATALAKAAAAS